MFSLCQWDLKHFKAQEGKQGRENKDHNVINNCILPLKYIFYIMQPEYNSNWPENWQAISDFPVDWKSLT